MWESVRLKCELCGNIFDDLVKRAERDEQHICLSCGERAAIRIMAVPSIRTSDSASHLDGTNRFSKLKETWALRQAKAKAKAGRDFAEEKRISKEINKVNK